ncbi:MAG: energy-coupling factor ABC transporter ATP-binding protein [Hydrogenothermaceae bacterium]|nr:energy-coupling factor ABC transporter ATP-binding protein [Hydrogenothermaceae bacterium]
MINLKEITYKNEKQTVLDSISLHIEDGEKIILIGVNGTGKTTLLKILNGLMFPSSGEYIYNGQKVDKNFLKKNGKIFRKEVVMLFQNPDVMLFNPTVYDEISFGLKQFNFSDVEERVKYWAEMFGITKYLNTSPFELSGGEKQKVALASILAIEPKVLLLDEPTSNLDPRATGWLIDFLQNLNLTMVITTHNLSIAPELGNRVVVLGENHRILYDGDIDIFLKDEKLLIEANLVHVHKHRHNGLIHSHFHIHNWE